MILQPMSGVKLIFWLSSFGIARSFVRSLGLNKYSKLLVALCPNEILFIFHSETYATEDFHEIYKLNFRHRLPKRLWMLKF